MSEAMDNNTAQTDGQPGVSRNTRKTREGLVVSDKMDKTVVVSVEDRVKHALYGKVMRRTSKLKAHDEQNDCGVGDRVLIEDGMLRFVCTDKNYNELRCTCTVGGVLKTSKGINLPNTVVNLPSITDRDWECADWAIDNKLDYLALSFVRRAEDINLLREHLRNRDGDCHIIAKIEKSEALREIGRDLSANVSDLLMLGGGSAGRVHSFARSTRTSPSWFTTSPANSARMTSTHSRSRALRTFLSGHGAPVMCSLENSPVPSASARRPGNSSASVAAAWATIAGW